MHSFDVRVFNPFAPSYDNTPLAQCYRRNKQKKRRAYDLTTGVDNIWRYGYQGHVRIQEAHLTLLKSMTHPTTRECIGFDAC